MEGERKRDRNEATASLVVKNNERFSKLEELLPGIPNEVTLTHITTRMSWGALHPLSSVSRTWRQAIHSRLVYDTRAHSHGTETLVVLNHSHSAPTPGIALYSLRDRAFYHLPPIPNVNRGFPRWCQFVGFDGKIYILGGLVTGKTQPETEKVYVLDVGGRRQWKECASMQEPRAGGGCGVLDGKIYVFGSVYNSHASQVYDPNTDAWSKISDKFLLNRIRGSIPGPFIQVATVGEELVMWDDHCSLAYHPVKLEWRDLLLPQDFLKSAPGRVFMAQGNFHSMSSSEINVYDLDTNSWTLLHSYSLAGIKPGLVGIDAVLAVGGELLAMVRDKDEPSYWGRYFLIQSQRFNSEDKELVWQEAEFSLPIEGYPFAAFMCPLQL